MHLDKKPALVKRERRRAARLPRFIAYDLETDPIRAGSPRPLYLTAYGDGFQVERRIRSMSELHDVLVRHLLIEATQGARFVAWNGNRFDAYFIAAALVRDPRYRLRPMLTRSRELRALEVRRAENAEKVRDSSAWVFVDGMAQLGIDCTLAELLDAFAPELPKLPAPDWSKGFDGSNPDHRAYAMRDSEGLWHAMQAAQAIVSRAFGEPLGITIGGTGIRVFQAELPERVVIKPLEDDAEPVVREFLVRGGYVFCRGKFDGPAWKYDLNQAYAGAMRDCRLPCGSMLWDKYGPEDTSGAYMVRVAAHKPGNTVPFYCKRRDELGRVRATYARSVIEDSWITSDEHRQLIAEGWSVECLEHWAFARTFTMRAFVDKCERLRREAPGGPSGPTGLMIKAIGNTAYGKTGESPDGIEWCLAAERPEGWLDWYEGEDADPIEHVFWRPSEPRPKPHQQPQLAAWITAHVRMQVRRAALVAPEAWLYADTDCVIFSRDVTGLLDVHPTRYGAWKVESAGERHRIILPKVYQGPKGIRARGMDAYQLTGEHFERWMAGEAPRQTQMQLRNFLDVMRGAEMYRAVTRRGSAIQPEEETV